MTKNVIGFKINMNMKIRIFTKIFKYKKMLIKFQSVSKNFSFLCFYFLKRKSLGTSNFIKLWLVCNQQKKS
ncbi:uncharacterized protein DS421_3g101540 [Arachis hypogaea]|nr:uncharacterized protein DS421_3g101540 [Arachis hypogaea]